MSHAADLIGLLGSPHRSEAVQAALKELGVDPKKVRLKRGEFDVSIEVASAGIELEFADPEANGIAWSEPEGTLVLSAVFFVSPSAPIGQSLPAGLGWGMTRAAARQLLGAPSWSSPVVANDRWRVADHDVTIRFGKSDAAQMFIFSLPK